MVTALEYEECIAIDSIANFPADLTGCSARFHIVFTYLEDRKCKRHSKAMIKFDIIFRLKSSYRFTRKLKK